MGILSGAALIFFAYTGFARVTIMAEEVKDPEKTIPRSIYLALGISTVIYLLVSIVAVGLVGAPALAQFGSPLADAFQGTGSSGAILLISPDISWSNDRNSERAADHHHGNIPHRLLYGPRSGSSPAF